MRTRTYSTYAARRPLNCAPRRRGGASSSRDILGAQASALPWHGGGMQSAGETPQGVLYMITSLLCIALLAVTADAQHPRIEQAALSDAPEPQSSCAAQLAGPSGPIALTGSLPVHIFGVIPGNSSARGYVEQFDQAPGIRQAISCFSAVSRAFLPISKHFIGSRAKVLRCWVSVSISSKSKIKPLLPASTSSSVPPTGVTITGSPAAIASSMAFDIPSL